MPVHTNQKTKTPEEATLWGFLYPIMYRVPSLCPPQQRHQPLEERLVGAGDRVRLRAVQ